MLNPDYSGCYFIISELFSLFIVASKEYKAEMIIGCVNTYLFHISTNNTASHAGEKYSALATTERVMHSLTNGPHLSGGGGPKLQLQPA